MESERGIDCEKESEMSERGVKAGMDAVGEGGSCEKDLRLVSRLFSINNNNAWTIY